jgi:hypothetical protein
VRFDDDPDITLAEMLEFARHFPMPLLPAEKLSEKLVVVPEPRQIRLPDTPLVVPDTCLRMVDGPLVGL